jgi:trimeric autotransporter adhesin
MKNHPFLLTVLCLFWSTASLFSQVQVVSSAGTTAATNYTTLSGAFAAVNNGTHQGVITISISSNITETTTAILNASSGSASYSSVSIMPSGGAQYLITGNLPVLIDLNGADNVTINGLNTGGNGLIFENTNTASISIATIRFRSDATLNTMQNCTFLGASTAASYGSNTSATIHIAGSYRRNR